MCDYVGRARVDCSDEESDDKNDNSSDDSSTFDVDEEVKLIGLFISTPPL